MVLCGKSCSKFKDIRSTLRDKLELNMLRMHISCAYYSIFSTVTIVYLICCPSGLTAVQEQLK